LLCVLIVLVADIYARVVSEPKDTVRNSDRYAGAFFGPITKSLFVGLILLAVVLGIEHLAETVVSL
jgi:hypothetical protein